MDGGFAKSKNAGGLAHGGTVLDDVVGDGKGALGERLFHGYLVVQCTQKEGEI